MARGQKKHLCECGKPSLFRRPSYFGKPREWSARKDHDMCERCYREMLEKVKVETEREMAMGVSA